MPFLFGIGYIMVRGAGKIARACGAGEEFQSEVRKVAVKIALPLDPIGSVLGTVHELADVSARGGCETGKKIGDVIDASRQVDNVLSGWKDR